MSYRAWNDIDVVKLSDLALFVKATYICNECGNMKHRWQSDHFQFKCINDGCNVDEIGNKIQYCATVRRLKQEGRDVEL